MTLSIQARQSQENLEINKAVIDYMDVSEESNALIALENEDFSKTQHTHLEIHPSLILGVMIFSVVFSFCCVVLPLIGFGLSKKAAQNSKTDMDKAIAIKTFLLSI